MDTIVEIPGAPPIRARVEGAEGAPWVVFSNSLVTDLTIWDAQAAALAGSFRLLRYDQRGHGQTPPGASPPKIADLGRDLEGLLDHFGIAEACFVGLSMGVPTVLSVLRNRPGAVARLVLSDGQAATLPAGAKGWAERIDFARANGMQRVAEVTAERWLSPASLGGPVDRGIRAMIAGTPLPGYVHGATALQDYDYAAEVGRIACPLLVVAGALDGAMPENMRKTFGEVPGARVEVIPEAGHVPCYEQPAAFNAALLRFLGLPA